MSLYLGGPCGVDKHVAQSILNVVAIFGAVALLALAAVATLAAVALLALAAVDALAAVAAVAALDVVASAVAVVTCVVVAVVHRFWQQQQFIVLHLMLLHFISLCFMIGCLLALFS
jgi:hypothetical protein